MSKLKILHYCLIFAAILVLPACASAQTTSSVVNVPSAQGTPSQFSGLQLGIPGSSATNPAQLVADIYNFALMIAGLLAFGSILYGGIMYLTTGGNPSAQSEAKNRIRDAIIGLLLLVGIYFVMNLINPDLTKLKFPSLAPLPPPTTQGSLSNLPTIDPNANAYACKNKSDGKIVSCFTSSDACQSNCNVDKEGAVGEPVPGTQQCASVKGQECISQGAASLPAGQCSTGPCQTINLPWQFKNGNTADAVMVKELQCLASAGVVLRITEAMPPTVQHLSKRHTDGCAVDATIPVVTSAKDCSKICDLQQQILNCGGSSLNEYYTLCANTSCPGTNTEHATADHIHINASCY